MEQFGRVLFFGGKNKIKAQLSWAGAWAELGNTSFLQRGILRGINGESLIQKTWNEYVFMIYEKSQQVNKWEKVINPLTSEDYIAFVTFLILLLCFPELSPTGRGAEGGGKYDNIPL